MKKRYLYLSALPLIVLLIVAHHLWGRTNGTEQSLSNHLPLDPKVLTGRLENGLKYYIRENQTPKNRVELRLVVRVGSLIESEHQQGFAHLIEHMAFNGTKHFPKQLLIDKLQALGMDIGPDISAATNFNRTIYRLRVPVDQPQMLDQALMVLSDWAGGLALEDAEIEKERSVVIEEWRFRKGAQARLQDRHLPILLKGSHYPNRMPIGQKAVLDTFRCDDLRQFYRHWYRPDLMAVVAVGDIKPKDIETRIQSHFSSIPARENCEAPPIFQVPDHAKTLFSIQTDPEATKSEVKIYFKQAQNERRTIGAYRHHIVETLFNLMLNARFYEQTQRPHAPFLKGYAKQGQLVPTKKFHLLGAQVNENGVAAGLDALLSELSRIRQTGFTEPELERQKKRMIAMINRIYQEQNKIPSRQFAAEYVRHHLTDEPIPGIEYESKLYKRFVPQITRHEVDQIAQNWAQDSNCVVLIDLPQKPGIAIPTETALLDIVQKAKGKEVEVYCDGDLDRPLIAHPPIPGKIVQQKYIKNLDLTEWRLSNGVRVVLKPTNFKNGEIAFTSFSPGGYSLVADKDYIAAITASTLIERSGVGSFDGVALQKKLAGKSVKVSPWIGPLFESISGQAAVADLETMFQLTYLYFTAPRKDNQAFKAYQEQRRGRLENRRASPQAAFSDSMRVAMANGHFRQRPLSSDLLNEMDLQRSWQIYRDRFADAGDFTFLFVGNFTPDSLKPFVASYLGGLPSTGRQETWKDVTPSTPEGVVEKVVYRGLDAQSLVQIAFSGPLEWTPLNHLALEATADILGMKLRATLRDALGLVYDIRTGSALSRYPKPTYRINVILGCAPDRVVQISDIVRAQIDSLRTFGATDENIQKFKAIYQRKRETQLQDNRYWLNALQNAYFQDDGPSSILEYKTHLQALTPDIIRKSSLRCLDPNRYVKVVLYPESWKSVALH